ncbi:MAG: LysR family transcriptional regulator [Negativicutes bacterium]|nr:LysR family transcriptional regulator [Negativicutes bacterium]
MNDKDWVILKTISEEKNITKAAERLYISQPALTYRLKSLEKEFGVKILFRTPKGVNLTPQGEHLLAYSEEMLLQLIKTKERLQNSAHGICGTLRLGSSSVFAHYELPRILKGFLELYPEVEISLQTGLSRRVNRMLQKEDLAVAILRGDFFWSEEKFLLREEPICLVSRKPIEIENLPDHPRINYGTDSSLQAMAEEWWQQTFFRPSFVTMQVDTMDTCRQMVLHNLGWAILPTIGLQQQDGLYKKELYWKSGEPLVRRTWVMCRTASLDLSTVRAFVDYLKEHYR